MEHNTIQQASNYTYTKQSLNISIMDVFYFLKGEETFIKNNF